MILMWLFVSMIKVIFFFQINAVLLIYANFYLFFFFLGSTNTATVNQLVNATSSGGYHLLIKGKKIFMLYDVPHIIKNIRNALSKYKFRLKIIKWPNGNKSQKHYLGNFKVLKISFSTHLTNIFSAMRKIKPIHFQLSLSHVKRKVAYATQIFRSTLAAAIESKIASHNLHAEVIYTAEFVHFIDSIFDSLNRQSTMPSPGRIQNF